MLLGGAGFVVKMATTFQDVAVDRMAAATALSSLAIARLGPTAAYLLSAAFTGAITLCNPAGIAAAGLFATTLPSVKRGRMRLAQEER